MHYDGWSRPTTVQLEGLDRGVGHAVTIVGKWIFDATMTHAMLLTHEVLDLCCLSNKTQVSFRCVRRAVRMILEEKKRESPVASVVGRVDKI